MKNTGFSRISVFYSGEVFYRADISGRISFRDVIDSFNHNGWKYKILYQIIKIKPVKFIELWNEKHVKYSGNLDRWEKNIIQVQ